MKKNEFRECDCPPEGHHCGKMKRHFQRLMKKKKENEFSECGCPSHRDQNGVITVNPNKDAMVKRCLYSLSIHGTL